MFKNIGRKIRGIALAVFWLYVIAGGLIALLSLTEDDVGIGLLVLLLCVMVGWLSSAFLYAFGELVQNSTEIREMLYFLPSQLTKQNKADKRRASCASELQGATPRDQQTNEGWIACPHCAVPQRANQEFCCNCGRRIREI